MVSVERAPQHRQPHVVQVHVEAVLPVIQQGHSVSGLAPAILARDVDPRLSRFLLAVRGALNVPIGDLVRGLTGVDVDRETKLEGFVLLAPIHSGAHLDGIAPRIEREVLNEGGIAVATVDANRGAHRPVVHHRDALRFEAAEHAVVAVDVMAPRVAGIVEHDRLRRLAGERLDAGAPVEKAANASRGRVDLEPQTLVLDPAAAGGEWCYGGLLCGRTGIVDTITERREVRHEAKAGTTAGSRLRLEALDRQLPALVVEQRIAARLPAKLHLDGCPHRPRVRVEDHESSPRSALRDRHAGTRSTARRSSRRGQRSPSLRRSSGGRRRTQPRCWFRPGCRGTG